MPPARTSVNTAPATKTTSNEVPESLRPYTFHGLDLASPNSSKEAVGDCPFCGREGKFSVNVETGQWRCFVCGGDRQTGGGGPVDFIEKLWEVSDKATKQGDYVALAKDRGLEFPETVIAWQLAKSVITGEWLIPGWGLNYKGQLEFQQLYKYSRSDDGKRNMLWPTPGRKHTLLGLNLYTESCAEVHVCEGPWDAMRWWESLRSTKMDAEGRLLPTSAAGNSLIQGISVLAAATCTTFPQQGTAKFFKGKVAVFLYDSDHPRLNERTGNTAPPAGMTGMQRDAAKVLDVAGDVRYLAWGSEGYDPSLPTGFDLRDALRASRTDGLEFVLNRIEDIPLEWKAKAEGLSDKGEIACKPCDSWRTLVMSWRKAMKWTAGLEHGLASGLAACISVPNVGDQLWLKMIGPPSCGKTTLCEAFTVNKKHVIAKSTIRGFHSGFGSDSNEDHGLVTQIRNKMFVTKDGDTLLQTPNLGQVLSEGRDIYDGSSRTHYRNKMSKDYDGIRTSWLLCGTSSLRQIDSSELGERFLDCVVMHNIEEDLENEILMRKANSAKAHLGAIAVEGDARTHLSPELLNAYELTGGYIDYLWDNIETKLAQIEFGDWATRQCITFGKFVAYMRARPSSRQMENAERELAARLVSQLVRYAGCLAFVLNKSSVDLEVINRTRQIALDTARGVVLNATKTMYEAGDDGVAQQSLYLSINLPEPEVRKLLRFLKEIGVVNFVNFKSTNRKAWRLTPTVRRIYEQIINPERQS